ncbi:hypothetical protein, conserved in P.knowlesi [Plasmodium knowlesi strain H]|uniref:Uncharacterized protein n=3 Tax=Plasmodium knowlesi TaxID=5850 RepID=A0A5E7X5C6_PLAKH|nr:hypothetical protein, conserved in P.knowlesi [Plasmodium knowlesi strain H]OTN64681.1 Uncharacterized protein PKNOH_S130191100 [Plasmodium knowlesi]CAA9989074.1 hypothetical protein, conserved in P.knowlesi [Plasmodium knowlesi strain H]SBO27287.1 hypothetical protein, conserved in P.knowlesi [Plasmodium knowlesi strain H]SBO28914.1 hypothetical protein, conserved in P.knowlesi [Plasmodium knowlesi strain H]VVS78548.1 hypothetical protein, conserved in P.knowlesi [Plasmodium knowlesi strai
MAPFSFIKASTLIFAYLFLWYRTNYQHQVSALSTLKDDDDVSVGNSSSTLSSSSEEDDINKTHDHLKTLQSDRPHVPTTSDVEEKEKGGDKHRPPSSSPFTVDGNDDDSDDDLEDDVVLGHIPPTDDLLEKKDSHDNEMDLFNPTKENAPPDKKNGAPPNTRENRHSQKRSFFGSFFKKSPGKRDLTQSDSKKDLTQSDSKKDLTQSDPKKDLTQSDSKKDLTQSDSKKDLTQSDSKKDLTQSDSKKDLTQSDSKKDLTQSDSKKDLTQSDSKKDLTQSDSKKDLTQSDSKKDLTQSPLKGDEQKLKKNEKKSKNEKNKAPCKKKKCWRDRFICRLCRGEVKTHEWILLILVVLVLFMWIPNFVTNLFYTIPGGMRNNAYYYINFAVCIIVGAVLLIVLWKFWKSEGGRNLSNKLLKCQPPPQEQDNLPIDKSETK